MRESSGLGVWVVVGVLGIAACGSGSHADSGRSETFEADAGAHGGAPAITIQGSGGGLTMTSGGVTGSGGDPGAGGDVQGAGGAPQLGSGGEPVGSGGMLGAGGARLNAGGFGSGLGGSPFGSGGVNVGGSPGNGGVAGGNGCVCSRDSSMPALTPCCDGCHFFETSQSCSHKYVQRCVASSDGTGHNYFTDYVQTNCSGASAACDGNQLVLSTTPQIGSSGPCP
jgi:hypothetical protein